jgi:hypothetical protein
MIDELKIKPMSKMELARYFNISLHVLNSWLLPFKAQIGKYENRLYKPKQVKIIFDLFIEE